MSLDITEEWIIERVKLNQDKLDDVKSLALPGTYHEKITSLGYSLQNFTRLQHLDLSKNSLSSLKGLDHLTLLEQLNLYYNKIQDLKEIFRLRKNQNLRDIDLRLNPVTGNEPDYRLFIAHMLPLLRRLDDRAVRDSERKAALMHFSSGDAAEMFPFEEDAGESSDSVPSGSMQPRVRQVKNMVQKPSVLQDDDTVNDVIDYVNKGMGKTGVPASKSSQPATELHTKEDLVRIARKQAEEENRRIKATGDRRVKFTKADFEDENLKYTDEDAAYKQFQTLAHFTPHPGSSDLPPTVNKATEQQRVKPQATSNKVPEMNGDEYKGLPECTKLSFGDSTTSQEMDRRKNLTQIKFIESVLDLVDRYWNGSKSLHYHQKFQSLIQKPLEHYQKEVSAAREVQIKVLHDKLSTQQQQIDELHKQLHISTKQNSGLKKTDELSHAQHELESAKTRLQLTVSDNKILRNKVVELEAKLQQATPEKESVEELDRVRDLEQQKRELVQQVAALKRSVDQYEKISQLANMLQDSHRSLVSTNEHLLSELEDTRCRHQSEIEQLKWSYDQLRSTSKISNDHLLNGEL